MKAKKKEVKRRSRNSLSREEILKAALKIIQEKDVEALSMRRIARVLKCSVASPYAHFKNQEEIIDTLLQQGAEKLTQLLNDARKVSTDVFDQLEALADTFRDFALNNKSLHKLMFYSGSVFKKRTYYIPATYRVFLKTIRSGIIKKYKSLRQDEYFAIGRMLWAWLYGVLVLEMTEVFSGLPQNYNPVKEGSIIFRLLFSNLLSKKRNSSEKFFEGFEN